MEVYLFNESLNKFEKQEEEVGINIKNNLESSYVYDAKSDTLCIVGFGEHLLGIMYILKHKYDFKFVKERITEYQEILKKFELVSANGDVESYVPEIMDFGVYYKQI